MELYAENWEDYELIDAGNKEKLERWKDVILRRPDPTAIWPASSLRQWNKVDGFYHRSSKGGGEWQFFKTLPEFWTVDYKGLTFKVSPTGFKHTGLFPEQAANWDYMIDKISHADREIKVLNLFAYTGGATMACAYAGASEVVHVDASKGMVNWAKENMSLSHLEDHKIRFIVDDVVKFVEREARRGNQYDAILMDPPSYGRGTNKEVWQLEDKLYELIKKCTAILSEEPLFFLVNTYTTGFSALALANIMQETLKGRFPKGTLTYGQLGLPITKRDMILPCGIYGRYEN